MPNLGETWSMGEMAAAATTATSRLEAIVLATGPSRIRLITRTGRRITAPVSSWERVWHFVRPAPSTHHSCERERCTQEALFRYHPSPDRVVWVCEDHLPHGVAALFPGDRNELSEPRLSCVFCGGSVTQGDVIQLHERATVSHRCSHCKARWCPLVSRGLGDDGTILAQDLHGLRTLTPLEFVEVRMGYRSYRDLCRALGVGRAQHIDGLPIIQDHRLEDQLALAIEHVSEGRDTFESPPDPVTAPSRLTIDIVDPAIAPESMWRRRNPKWQAIVEVSGVEETQDGVVVNYTYRSGSSFFPDDPTRQPRADFLRYWAPLLNPFVLEEVDSVIPEVSTYWCHRETRQVVQVKLPTLTHVSNAQVSYMTLSGIVEATPIKTFRRLYAEIPTPPEHHYWARGREVFRVTRDGDTIGVHTVEGAAPCLKSLPSVEFFETFDALYFVTRYDYRNVRIGDSDPKGALISGREWKGDGGGSLVVLDVGLTCSGSEFVRYRQLGAERLVPLDEFVASFRYEVTVPCAVGETWAHQQNDDITVKIVDVHPFRGMVSIEEQQSTHRCEVRIDELVHCYRRLDIRSYWELLEAEDEDPSEVA